MSLWYKKIGFDSNPFSIKPAAYEHELVAYDVNFIYDKIDNAEMVFIEGDYGSGKTTLLKNIINTYKGKNKIIYYSFNEARNDFHVKSLLDGANSFLRKLSGLRVKNVIMLLDEVHTMNSSDAKQLLKFYQDGTIQSIIFVSHDYDITKFPKEVENYLNGNILRTDNLSIKEAIELVRRRIGNINLLSNNYIEKIYQISNKNPRRLLEYSEDVCRYAVEIGDIEVGEFHLNEVLGEVIKNKKTKSNPKTIKTPLKKATKKKVEKSKPTVVKSKEPKQENLVSSEKPVKTEIEDEPKVQIIDLEENEIEHKAGEGMVHETENLVEPVVSQVDKSVKKEKKYKINKLVENEPKDQLGKVSEKEKEEEIPEYKVYFYDN